MSLVAAPCETESARQLGNDARKIVPCYRLESPTARPRVPVTSIASESSPSGFYARTSVPTHGRQMVIYSSARASSASSVTGHFGITAWSKNRLKRTPGTYATSRSLT